MGIEERLLFEGLLPAEARNKSELFGPVEEALRGLGAAPARRFFVPGRIEVAGKHTDYAGGRSLLCAVGRGFCVAASPRTDRTVRIVDAGRGLAAEVALDPDLVHGAAGWTVYVQAVAGRLARDFPGGLRGADIAISSDLPRASGMSSSSALVVALFSVLADRNELAARPEYAANIRSLEDLGGYLGCVENGGDFGTLAGGRGVGTLGGSEDQTAILCCRTGELAQYSFCPVRRERSFPFEGTWSFVVATSGVASDKTGGAREKYNRLSLAVSAILDLWNRSTGRSDASLFAAATSGPDAPDRIRRFLRLTAVPEFEPEFLIRRFDQFVEESMVIIPSVGDLLAQGEAGRIGELVDRSQALAEECLGNQVPETVALVRLARELGAAAASAFGGGFGGSVWALVRTAEADAWRALWAQRYAQAFPAVGGQGRFFVTRPGPAVVRL